MTTGGSQRDTNAALWSRVDLVRAYESRELRPVERQLFADHRGDLASRTLELGCGAGRLTGYLAECSDQVVALDVSEAMLAACRRDYPTVRTVLGDLADLTGFRDGEFDAVVAGCNVIDVLDHDTRLRTLRELHRLVVPGGLLVLSSHNLAAADPQRLRVSVLARGRRHLLSSLVRLPRWLMNQRRRRAHEYRAADHGVLNDVSHDYEGLHYYVTRDAMVGQLDSAGWTVETVRDLDAAVVPPGSDAPDCMELHYVARRRPTN